MRQTLVLTVIGLIALPSLVLGAVAVEGGVDAGIVGSFYDPLDLPLGISLGAFGEHRLRENVRARAGVVYRAVWSEEERQLMEPDAALWASDRERGFIDAPLVFYGLSLGVRFGMTSDTAGPFGEVAVAAGQGGWEEHKSDAYLSFGAGYSWPLSQNVELMLQVFERAHLVAEHSEVSVAFSVGYREWERSQ